MHSSSKKLLSLIIFLWTIELVQGQVNTAWPAAGTSANVGIGSPSPGAKLEVVAPGATYDQVAYGTLQITRPTNPGTGANFALSFIRQGTTVSGIGYIDNTNNIGLWAARAYTNSTPQITLRDNGYVGINNPNPQVHLHVIGGQIISSDDANGGSLSVFKGQLGATAVQRLLVSGDNVDVYNLRIRQLNGGDFNSTVTASIDNAGNGYFAGKVGINTTAPQADLHIAGSNVNTIRLNAASDAQYYYSTITNKWDFNEAFSIKNHDYFIIKAKGDANQVWLGDPVGTQTINLTTSSGGTTAVPSGKLHIGSVGGANSTGYLLAVNGDIVAKKIKVTQTGWADYVFDPAYTLRPLEDVSSFIDQHKHLPDVPSASVVEQDGIDVGESQVTLLRKIEELTLYIIQMNQTIKLQQEQINSLLKVK